MTPWSLVEMFKPLQDLAVFVFWPKMKVAISSTNMVNLSNKINLFLSQKPTRRTISQLYFGKELCMFRTDLLSIIRSLNTVFTAIGICRTGYVECLLARSG